MPESSPPNAEGATKGMTTSSHDHSLTLVHVEELLVPSGDLIVTPAPGGEVYLVASVDGGRGAVDATVFEHKVGLEEKEKNMTLVVG